MLIKKVFNPIAVVRYIKMELLVSALVSSAAYALWYSGLSGMLSIPFSVTAILGSALAIFVAFRNNNSYSRWWEARTAWGNIVNNSRIFARQVLTCTEHGIRTGKHSAEEVQAYCRETIYRQIAFAHALRLQLRGLQELEVLKSLLSEREFKQLELKSNLPNTLLLVQSQRIREGIRSELLGSFDAMSIEPTLAGFNNFQGICERIKGTPLLRQYHYFTHLFLLVFTGLLPFSLVNDFSKIGIPLAVIPITMLVSLVFGIMTKVGEINEDPFENRATDVPLQAICQNIERDLREMLGESQLPPKPLPQYGILH